MGEPFDNAIVSDDFCSKIHVSRRSRSNPAPSGEMPVLFITGDLDDRTPVQLSESAQKGFTHSRLIVVRNGGHELLPEKAVQEAVADFFAGKDREEVRLSLWPREFASVAEAAHPPRRPR